MRSRGSLLRGERIGGNTSVEVDRGSREPRRVVSYWCAANHESRPQLATAAVAPETWACDRCGQPASREPGSTPALVPTRAGFPKTPLEFLLMRRSSEDGERLLGEALAELRSRRARARR